MTTLTNTVMPAPLHHAATIFLKLVLLLIGAGTLAALLIEPHFEGRNVGATFTEIYFQDPFLAYVYIASIPFFVALYQAGVFFGHIEKKNFPSAARAAQTIKYCGMALIVGVIGAEAFIILMHDGKDDIAGGIAMGVLGLLVSIVITTVAAASERHVQKKI